MTLPVPVPNADTKPYWDAAQKQELRFQKCRSCNAVQIVPRKTCSHCQSADLTWIKSEGNGRIVSFSIVCRAPTKSFEEEAPYVLALVDFDEGARLMLNVVGEDKLQTAIGDRVAVTFQPRGADGFKIPQVERVCA